jgi:hypothetical protein
LVSFRWSMVIDIAVLLRAQNIVWPTRRACHLDSGILRGGYNSGVCCERDYGWIRSEVGMLY